MPAPTSTRRTVLARTAAAVSAGGAAIVGVGYATSSAAIAVAADDDFVTDDVRIERNDGEVDAVTVAPELEVAWRNFDGGLQAIDVTLSAAIEGAAGFDVLLDATVGDSDGIKVDVVGAQGDSETVFETVTFDVTVRNPEGEASATGRAHADAE